MKQTIFKITEFGSTNLVSRLVFFTFDKRYPCPAVIFSLVDVGLIDGWFILLWFVCRLQQSCYIKKNFKINPLKIFSRSLRHMAAFKGMCEVFKESLRGCLRPLSSCFKPLRTTHPITYSHLPSRLTLIP